MQQRRAAAILWFLERETSGFKWEKSCSTQEDSPNGLETKDWGHKLAENAQATQTVVIREDSDHWKATHETHVQGQRRRLYGTRWHIGWNLDNHKGWVALLEAHLTKALDDKTPATNGNGRQWPCQTGRVESIHSDTNLRIIQRSLKFRVCFSFS